MNGLVEELLREPEFRKSDLFVENRRAFHVAIAQFPSDEKLRQLTAAQFDDLYITRIDYFPYNGLLEDFKITLSNQEKSPINCTRQEYLS